MFKTTFIARETGFYMQGLSKSLNNICKQWKVPHENVNSMMLYGNTESMSMLDLYARY